MNNLYCKIFISGPVSVGNLAEKLSDFINVNSDKFLSIEGKYFTIDVLTNKEFDKEKTNEFTDGFLYYPYFLDLECTDEANEDEYIKLISDLLLHFWSENYKVVAASDFEDKLPRNGGYGQPINQN